MIAKKRFREKDSFSSKILKYLAVLFVLIIIIFLISSNLKLYQKRMDIGNRIGELNKKIQALEEKNQQFRAEINRTQSRGYLEEVAFEKLNLKPIGAEVGVIASTQENKTEETQKEKSLWERILDPVRNFFGGL